MNIVFFDDETWQDLLPLTFTRPVSEIRIGILTIKEKWQPYFKEAHFSNWTYEAYLEEKFPLVNTNDTVYINSKVIPDIELVTAIAKLNSNESISQQNHVVAFKGHVNSKAEFPIAINNYVSPIFFILNVWDIFQKNGEAIVRDFKLLTHNRKSEILSDTVTVIGDKSLIFLEPGASCEAAILNTKNGPIYIGKDAEVMEGSVIRGPFSLGEHSSTKLCTKIYGPTTIGPHCKVGGEINNSVIFGFTNKAHDGFLGNSVLGEWCNLGADTNNSNLKNNYANVKVYNYRQQKMIDTGLQFCGLIMGDHSKTGINTMLNTGTVVGVACNIYGGNFPPTHVSSFKWGGAEGLEPYKFEKFVETVERVYQRRGLVFNQAEKTLLKAIEEKRS
jgi:UDP-N-acetylglucosamine diphosphorylase/glucosamine-1-phosphate N-acetyltransferase